MIPDSVRLILVEDDEDDMVLTTQLLRDIGMTRFDVKWVSDYHDALEELSANRHDVCLADYRLGEHNGVDLAKEAISHGCRVPIILLTGQGDHEIDLAAMNAGAADFLNKGQITPPILERSIRYAIQHRRMEEQRIGFLREQSARAEAEAANRAKDQFLAILSHELRTPLTAVLMSASALDLEKSVPGKSRELVQIIKRNAELEARLIDDLLDVTRIARGKLEIRREIVDLHSQIQDAVHLSCGAEIAAKGIRVQVNLHAQEYHVWGDAARLQQVLWNLIRNAVKFTPEGGEIEVTTSNDAAQALGQVDSLGPSQNAQMILVEVRDTGIGIEPEALPRIFNAFEQVDRNITRQFGGLGLGLAIGRKLVQMHGGQISAHSAGRNQGATFSIELPVAVNIAGVGHTDHPADSAIAHASKDVSILLVEDHPDTARAMSKILKKRGYHVHSAPSMAQALQIADTTEFDLLISDIGLPDGSGLELMRALCSKRPVKGIALSGFGMEEDVSRSRAAGFTEHLTKPVDIKHLEDAIARVTQPTQSQDSRTPDSAIST